MSNIYNLHSSVQSAVQEGILELAFRYGLTTQPGFSAFTYKRKLKGNLGESQTFTQTGRMAVDLTPSTPDAGNSNLNNGMTPTEVGLEQFTISLLKWNRLMNVNLLQEKAMIDSDLKRKSMLLGENAFMTKDRLVRKAYLDTYLGGNSKVISGGTTNTTTAHVDDIRGFQYVLQSGGKLVPVSGTDTLTVNQYDSSGNLIQALTVTGVTADGTNVSSLKDNGLGGISGQITFSSATQPTVGHALIAANAPKVMRAGAKLVSSALGAGDLVTTSLMSSARAYLKAQGNKGIGGSMYALCSPQAIQQLNEDPSFRQAYQGRFDAKDIVKGTITEHGGIRYIETNEVPISAGTGADVHRILLLASDEACMEADWEGFDQFIAEKQGQALHHAEKIQSNLAMIVRDPIDVNGEQQPLSYMLVTGFCCGSDLLANNTIIPTASGSMFKKAMWIEHAA